MALSSSAQGILVEGAASLGVTLLTDCVDLLNRYLAAIEETNAHTNLTRITGNEAVTGHFLDALSIVTAVPLTAVQSLVDIGTGAGIPGMVLKIIFPHLKVLLIDSLMKRVSFLNQCISAFGLQHINAVHGRAEDLGRVGSYREQYHLALSRAVGDLRLLSELSAPFVLPGGLVAAYKAHVAQEELQGASEHGAKLGLLPWQTVPVLVPMLEAKRVIAIAQKTDKTPPHFPRSSKTLAREKTLY